MSTPVVALSSVLAVALAAFTMFEGRTAVMIAILSVCVAGIIVAILEGRD